MTENNETWGDEVLKAFGNGEASDCGLIVTEFMAQRLDDTYSFSIPAGATISRVTVDRNGQVVIDHTIRDNQITIEQMCRELLAQALADGLVSPSTKYEDPNPLGRMTGELTGVANMLSDFIARSRAKR